MSTVATSVTSTTVTSIMPSIVTSVSSTVVPSNVASGKPNIISNKSLLVCLTVFFAIGISYIDKRKFG